MSLLPRPRLCRPPQPPKPTLSGTHPRGGHPVNVVLGNEGDSGWAAYCRSASRPGYSKKWGPGVGGHGEQSAACMV